MENMNLLNEEELAELTPEERDILESALAVAETVEMLPDDVTTLLTRFEELTANKTEYEAVRKLFELAQDDPAYFSRLMALVDIAEDVAESGAVSFDATGNENIESLSDEEYSRAEARLFESLVKMTPDNRKEFVEVLEKRTPAQEKAMLDELKK